MVKSGAMRDVMHSVMTSAGNYRRGVVQAANRGVRAFSQDDRLDEIGEGTKALLKGNFGEAADRYKEFKDALMESVESIRAPIRDYNDRMEDVGKRPLVDRNIELKRKFNDQRKVTEEMIDQNVSRDLVTSAEIMMAEIIKDTMAFDAKKAASSVNRTGYRLATMGDLIDMNLFSQSEDWVANAIKSFQKSEQSRINSKVAAGEMKAKTDGELNKMAINQFRNSIADENIYIDTTGNISDFRDFKNTFEGFINSASTEFTIPLIKINPMRMFYLDQFFGNKRTPTFHFSLEDIKNPFVTGHNGSQAHKHLYLDGKVMKINEGFANNFEDVSGDFFLASARTGPLARLTRNMAGITISKFVKPELSDGIIDRARYNVQSVLDIGLQDEPMGQFDLLDPTSWVTSLINTGTKHLRLDNYQYREELLEDSFGKSSDYFYMRRHKSIDEAGSYRGFLEQFTAGRKNLGEVTLSSMFPYGFFERLNATLNQINMGLSNKSLGDASSVFGNLLLKRIAPVWAGVEMWDYLNYESENFFGTQFEDQFAMTYANSSIEAAKIRDSLGITEWAKGISPLLVGGEHIADIPILGDMLDWNDTAEETAEFWEEGEVAVRKGRWWPLGNTPYTGSNIDYFQPNWVRRTLADYEFSDSLYGSREEYFQNTWMPTLSHPLAPIRHFLTDPYHYEEKHYEDRPYMVTGGIPEIENFPLIGPFLNATVGQILKPQIAMHHDEWQQETAIAPVNMGIMGESGTIADALPVYGSGAIGAINSPSTTIDYFKQPVSVGYSTSSGATTVLETDEAGNVYNLLPDLSWRTPSSTGNFKPTRAESSFISSEMPVDESALTVGSAYSMLGNLHYNMGEMGGFYGFMAFSMTGEIADTRPVIQSSSDMQSYTRQFWDNDIGGFGGDANEIFRRFLPADRKLNEINTIDNSMPEWLPGSNYFIDFQSGDPYTKLKKGELRLPGEGYERAYNIDSEDLMKMEIGASFIGYDEQRIRDHLLKNDVIKDEALNNILDKGTDWHVDWEKEMIDKGITLSSEQYVKDEEMGIGGFYDVEADHSKALDWLLDNAVEFMYYQPTYGEAPEGADVSQELGRFFYEPDRIDLSNEEDVNQFKNWALAQSDRALIDPKTRSQKRFDEDEMHYENVQQVNFYAQQKGTPINYLIHVNRDDPSQGIKVFAFGANPELLESSMQKVEGVRNQLKSEIEAGDLHRGNLYDMIDRYRILGDVAPYSQEFRDMKTQLKNMNLDEEEMAEARIINDQVSARKEKLRLYPYRFKNADVETDTLTVDKIIDNNTFLSKEFPENPITLAGVEVSTAKDSEEAEYAHAVIRKAIKEGGEVRVLLDSDENNRIKDNTYKTIDAVIFDKHGRNVNKELIEQGLGKEKENDYSPTGVHARFSESEIAFGSMWESFAHMDTMIHTKLLQVRSPIESYERREVYGSSQ